MSKGRRASLADTETSSSRSATPAVSNKRGTRTPKPMSRASITNFNKAIQSETKAGKASEASLNKRAERRREIKANERRIKLEAQVANSQTRLQCEREKAQFDHEQAKLGLENERLRLQIQLASVQAQSLPPPTPSTTTSTSTFTFGQPFDPHFTHSGYDLNS